MNPTSLYPTVSMVKGPRFIKKRRSTYSLNNALRFKPIFDKAIETRTDIIIPYEGTPTTFHIKCGDALKWLVDNWDKEDYTHLRDPVTYKPRMYSQLRGEIKFRSTEEGILILWNTSIIVPHFYSLGQPKTNNLEWKDQLVEFLESDGKMLKIDSLYLSSEDIEWIKNTLKDLKDVIFDVTTTTLMVGKGL